MGKLVTSHVPHYTPPSPFFLPIQNPNPSLFSFFPFHLPILFSLPPKTMRFVTPNHQTPLLSSLLSLFLSHATVTLLCLAPPSSASIHDLLRSQGLPPGLLPKEVKSYTLSGDGLLEVFLNGPCLTKFENLVYFDSVVRANFTYASLTGVVGLSQEELFLWLPVKDIIVSDPDSGLILFDIGVAHKQLSLSLFEDPPQCRAPQQGEHEDAMM